MNFWYHGSYTKGDHHEQDREIIRRISSFRTFRDSVFDPFETVFTGGWFDEISYLILSSGVWVHGYKPCINSLWVYRYILSIVTYPIRLYNYVKQILNIILKLRAMCRKAWRFKSSPAHKSKRNGWELLIAMYP